MHLTGKICAWLMVPAVLAAVVLTGQAVNVRNSWTEKSDSLSASNQTKAASIKEKESQLQDLKADRSLLMRSWGRPWSAGNVTVSDAEEGVISIDLGTQSGLQIASAESPPVLFGFFAGQDGASRFIGPFQVEDLRDRNSTLRITKYPRPGDTDTWEQGTWRFWQFLPTQYTNRFESQWNALLEAEERQTQTTRLEQTMVHQNELSNDQIEERDSELVGGDKLPLEGNLPAEDLQGLVKTLSQEEEARNEVMLEVDQLRREIHAAQVTLQSLLEESRQLVDQLPQPSVDTAANTQN